jgi:hypothetical protein
VVSVSGIGNSFSITFTTNLSCSNHGGDTVGGSCITNQYALVGENLFINEI